MQRSKMELAFLGGATMVGASPYMIVASNGMLTGGRMLNHLLDLVDDPKATLLFVGYHGEGTLGSHIQRGCDR